MNAPNRKRHFLSRLVSPSSRLNARYDIGGPPVLRGRGGGGLAARAVMRRPAAQADDGDRGAAARARLALAAVDAKLFLVAARLAVAADVVADGRAAPVDRLAQHLRDRLAQAVGLGAAQVAAAPRGVQPGAEQRLVGVDVADAGDDALAEQHRLDGALGAGQRRAPGGRGQLERLRPQAVAPEQRLQRLGPLVPAHAAEAARVAEAQLLTAAVEVEDDVRVRGQALVRGGDGELPGHAEVDDDGALVVEVEEDPLAAPPQAGHGSA